MTIGKSGIGGRSGRAGVDVAIDLPEEGPERVGVALDVATRVADDGTDRFVDQRGIPVQDLVRAAPMTDP
jgi:hypothetical protein